MRLQSPELYGFGLVKSASRKERSEIHAQIPVWQCGFLLNFCAA
jgi:hypothetical protein